MSKLAGGNYFELAGGIGGIGLTPNATADTKGSYSELASSTAQDWGGFHITISRRPNSGNFEYLFDVAVGAAASEVNIVSNLRFSGLGSSSADTGWSMWCPIPIPAGTRISARCQCGSASGSNIHINVTGYGPHPDIPQAGSATVYGSNASTTMGDCVLAASGGSKGSWSQIVASTTNDMGILYVHFGGADDSAFATQWGAFDIGIGANPNEVVLIPDITCQHNVGEQATTLHGPYFVNVPSGVRLSARTWSQSGSMDSVDVTVIGFSRG